MKKENEESWFKKEVGKIRAATDTRDGTWCWRCASSCRRWCGWGCGRCSTTPGICRVPSRIPATPGATSRPSSGWTTRSSSTSTLPWTPSSSSPWTSPSDAPSSNCSPDASTPSSPHSPPPHPLLLNPLKSHLAQVSNRHPLKSKCRKSDSNPQPLAREPLTFTSAPPLTEVTAKLTAIKRLVLLVCVSC